jgi:CheY-like chemotaxis protein
VSKPLSILLVEDNASMREVVELALRTAGHRVASQPDGREAIAALRAEPVDLIITDVLMPKMDGVEFIQYVHQTWPEIPIIAMSGGGERLPVEYCLKTARTLGAAATLEKPFLGSQLLAAVAEALAKPGRPAGPA